MQVGKGTVEIHYGLNADLFHIDDSLAAAQLAHRSAGQPMLTASRAATTELVSVRSPDWPLPRKSWLGAAVVSCIGFGEEITSERPPAGNWNGYRGPQFWLEDDRMWPAAFPLVNGRVPKSILISGSGDGAMQDFQRAATGRFGRALYEEIERAVGASRFSPENSMLAPLLAEDLARRAHAFRSSRDSVEVTLNYWHVNRTGNRGGWLV
ncbi:hypothetical protein LGM58_40270 [Burkholderia contaminans]|uniref:hypothetical protein n=1 Tax=Burkholderia contaminans TaxID=488447 RepID=UPI001CF187BE|nr:hypothetical protein [Burkholderia contaminans]MCA7889422.1 hypothetical protein [Burkholderia contaminans]